MADFIPGSDLARTFYDEVVAGAIDRPHTACLIGEGSEVQGYDDERSRDHEWGPRLQLFVAAADVDDVTQAVRSAVPPEHRGYPTHWFSLAEGRVSDHLEITTTELWMSTRLPTVPTLEPDTADWLAIPQQHLRQLTAGEVFHDGLGELSRLRTNYAWYPTDVWCWMLACQWHLIGQALPLLGRALETSDARGGQLLAGRLAELMMEMAFLQEQVYRPYAKWFGRAFAELQAAGDLGPLIDRILVGHDDDAIAQALLLLGRCHDELGITEQVGPRMEQFTVGIGDAVRPYPVLNTGEYIDASVASIGDRALRDLPRVGSLDQLTHADDTLITFTDWPRALAERYRAQLSS
ncbi:MAG: DUF4037 domain-containing protein [Brachybacterium tyrofermentans]|uniref:DUF4037 domain-containing protein n=1 Tax=Brachybacterium tyrofermentans TaxID=47848 RepID=UPI003FB78C26